MAGFGACYCTDDSGTRIPAGAAAGSAGAIHHHQRSLAIHRRGQQRQAALGVEAQPPQLGAASTARHQRHVSAAVPAGRPRRPQGRAGLRAIPFGVGGVIAHHPPGQGLRAPCLIQWCCWRPIAAPRRQIPCPSGSIPSAARIPLPSSTPATWRGGDHLAGGRADSRDGAVPGPHPTIDAAQEAANEAC